MFYVSGVSTLVFVILSFLVHFDTNEGEEDKLQQERLLSNHYNNQPNTLSSTTSTGEKKHRYGKYQSLAPDEETAAYSSHLYKASTTHSIATSVREEADEALESVGGVDLGLAISRIPSVDQSMAHILEDDVPSLSIFGSVRVITFLITTLMLGISLSMIVYFLFLFQGRDLHMPASWIGWNGPTGGITELLTFCFAKQVISLEKKTFDGRDDSYSFMQKAD
jgi:hypothetical protein